MAQKQISFLPFIPWPNLDLTLDEVELYNFWHHAEKRIPDSAIREHLARIFARYQETNGRRIEGITIANYTDNRSCDPLPQARVLHLVKVSLGLMFSTMVMNQAGWNAASPENFVLYHQNFVPGSKGLGATFGSYIKQQTLCSDMKQITFLRPHHVPQPTGPGLDGELMRALAGLAARRDDPLAGRLFESLRWVGQAFTNAEGVSDTGRIISMSIAFEILLSFPEREKARYFAEKVEKTLDLTGYPRSSRRLKSKQVSHTSLGWWCWDFYQLRSRIVHGGVIKDSDLFTPNGSEHLKVGLRVFDGCVRNALCSAGLFQWNAVAESFWRYALAEMLGLVRPTQ